MSGIKRQLYDELLKWRRRTNRQPLLLQGARQVGKTTLLEEFGRSEFRRTHYVNFERTKELGELFAGDLNPQRILEQLSILRGVDIDPATDLLILDEIQECPAALTALKYFREELPGLAVCGAGSLLGLALAGGSFPVGKVEVLELYPLSFAEYLAAFDPRLSAVLSPPEGKFDIPEAIHRKLWSALTDYLVVGGMPKMASRFIELQDDRPAAFREARQLQEDLLKGYRADFAKHAGKENAQHINRVFDSVPAQLAKAMDGSVARYRFKGVIPGRTKFIQLDGPIDWLVRARLLLQAKLVERPIMPLAAQTHVNLFKLYLFDVGLLGCMLELPADAIQRQDYGSYKGYVAENFVAQEFTAAGQTSLYWWQGRQSEIEFLLPRGEAIVPVEVKSGSCVRSRSLAAYADKYHPAAMIRLSGLNLDQPRPDLRNYPLYLAGQVAAQSAN